MSNMNIYLNFDGNCEEAFNFYIEVFGAKVSFLNRFSELPPDSGFELAEEDKNRIMHATLQIDDETILMGSDTFSNSDQKLVMGNNFSISMDTQSRERADELFAQLSSNGQITMPLQDTFWGAYFGSCTDRFGINWMVSCDANNKENG